MSMFDHHDPGYSTDRLYEYADMVKKERQENPGLHVGPNGRTRYVCPLGCGADFAFMTERELHVITEHEGDAA